MPLGSKMEATMNAVTARSSDLFDGLVRWTGRVAATVVAQHKAATAAKAARREAQAWVKAMPKGFLADLAMKVPMPEGFWDVSHHVLDHQTYEKAPSVFRSYVDEAFSAESEVRRAALASGLYLARSEIWFQQTASIRVANIDAGIQADQDRRDAAYADRLARAAATPHPSSNEGQRAYAEQSALSGVGYRHAAGRLLTRNECVQLGLSGRNASQPARGRLVDAHGLTD